jgi:hypothetical protein
VSASQAEIDRLTARMRLHEENRLAAFRLFIFAYLAAVGGSIYLSVGMSMSPTTQFAFTMLTDTAVFFLTLICVLMVAANLQTWFLYRRAQGEQPRLGELSAVIELAMIVGMVAAFLAFAAFNPFLVLPSG